MSIDNDPILSHIDPELVAATAATGAKRAPRPAMPSVDHEGFPSVPILSKADISHHKVFAKPVRLVFKKIENQEVTWIEISTLRGLKEVIQRLAGGVLVPLNAASTLQMQLWAHLAEHVGFLRFNGPSDEFSAGIQPLGAEQGQLINDMKEIFGGIDPGLAALSNIRDQVMRDIEARQPVEPAGSGGQYVKSDGVNLTPEGEVALADLVGESVLDMESDVAQALMRESEPGLTGEEIDAALADHNYFGDPDAQEVTGEEAAEMGRRVEEAGFGELSGGVGEED